MFISISMVKLPTHGEDNNKTKQLRGSRELLTKSTPYAAV